MGQKVNPHGLRVSPTLFKNWDSIWYAKEDYSVLLAQDARIRTMIFNKYSQSANVSRVVIERISNKNVIINIYVKKPGVIIGKSGSDIDKLKHEIFLIVKSEVYINIHEVKKYNTDANIVAQTIVAQLEKRVSFRRAMKLAMNASMKQGALGIKVSCSGRLGGAEIARTEWYREGRVPLHTLRADISYGVAEAMTTYGVIGVKVWIYNGDCTKITKRGS